ncbi:YbhB/YbcL family Raf kinase inhibitor-like protein [Enterococcus durans]|uniref:YbhB/YbcL family Raf kinase inhibitor-like protein n=1 Tax=Enterococcus durans TaxID=53345 RepID=A0A5N0YJN8_9ENTE|nr:YbhB/YbcL family Raf kinase inhibitor-like protein [Enterococcus durans]KAA9176596.1 YbhB/YbcL family Raf kinase inhibitor-like protein [Enterococcus durans]KAA9182380.1 YbhB/YbcL family Raf kinase inhibitor-like protein [Enterococcus durans]KAA9183346.1 YbhB/YbcL family Raf kinase inhibitor-like protein [Enterococcus durans]KAA9187593.1 YbhB/YbcL family Raf kinase inhibitor-like protein [Enterococcus durans]KAA9190022.1 YbhB/YbcL family Raf kinase inhibitor-like protein [Enterococcus duran
MKVTSKGIIDGIIQDKYGKRGSTDKHGIPTCSLPLKIENAPEGTKTFAIVIEDKDAIPVSGGFSWIHWVAANITKEEIEENESRTNKSIIQGLNSWISIQGGKVEKEFCMYYGGMAPPNKEHIYEIHVYALDCFINLENGFYLNDLCREMEGHILDQFTLKGLYNC